MNFVKIIGLIFSVAGLVLYFPPVRQLLENLFGYAADLTGAIVFASGWALVLAYIVFNLGVQSQKRASK